MSSADSIIVLDIDGTLTDSIRPHQVAFEEAMRFFAFPNLSTEWAAYKHHSDTGIFREAWEKADFPGQPDLRNLEENYKTAYDSAILDFPVSQIPGASQFVATMRSSWNIVFATGSLRHGAIHKLSVLGIAPTDFVLVTASEFHTREELVHHAVLRGCAEAGINTPRRVVSIGDGIWDLKTARNLGYEFIGIGQGAKAEQLLVSGAPVYTDFNALLADRDSIFSAGYTDEKRS
ncbi:HAD family hydrolase [Agrobacterium rhizogenes]|nr:HAD family hydrolase [Rhizobium rhizogenes]NTH53723.1 HAD family hydrolase [Rhizobium rhizogenes]NTH73307.1 HAD family hydrolase [Rhizobium rhizogenes]